MTCPNCERLEEALCRYGAHQDEECFTGDDDCRCGFSAAISAPPLPDPRDAEIERLRESVEFHSKLRQETHAKALEEMRADRAEIERLMAALQAIADTGCPTLRVQGRKCPEDWAQAMGGEVPRDEQLRRWCNACRADAALKKLGHG